MKTLTISLATALAFAGAAAAQEGQGPATVIRASDGQMSCMQISDEAAQLSEQMGGQPEGGVLGQVGGVAKAGASMLIPGAGLLFAGADALTADQRREREAQAAAVQHRWYYLNGLFSGKRCDAPVQPTAAVAPAAPAPGAPTAPVVVSPR